MAVVEEGARSGFSFENCLRNQHILKSGFKPPTAYKTGTTIAGIIFKDGVVLGADTRATEDTVVADKNCSKIHYLADNMYCCGAGTAADTEMTTQMISSQLELHKLNTGRTTRVATANRLLKQMLFSCCGAGTAADTEMTTQMISSQLELHKLNTGRTPRVATANRLLKQMLFSGAGTAADTEMTTQMISSQLELHKLNTGRTPRVATANRLLKQMLFSGAGTAADTEMTTQMISSQLELHKLNTGRTPRVATANRLLKQMLFRYQGYISAALVLGGVDITGPHLYSIHPHGSTDKLPYVTMGSGSLAAMATFEDGFKPDMTKEEALKLVRNAIAAGIFNDLGSGSNVDLCVITKDKVEYLRPYDEANLKGERAGNYAFKRGTTAVLTTDVKKIQFEVLATQVTSAETMDTA